MTKLHRFTDSEKKFLKQFAGMNGDADVVGLPGMHIEVKRVEKLNLENAVAQSERDAREDELPMVMHRKNRCCWLVTMPFNSWIKLYQAWEKENERIKR